jgi:hypothetical protein
MCTAFHGERALLRKALCLGLKFHKSTALYSNNGAS